ncbi:MAG TPA: GNAT family N-acetyltransferase [Microbacteriaceae bacterium]
MNDEPVSTGEVVLETDRLLLRRWRVSDAALQRELWAERDPRVPPHRRIDADGHPTLKELEDRIRREAASASDTSLGLLAAERRGSGDVIGYCGLIPNVHGQDGEPELAYEFLREVWRQGYATEAAQEVLGWATESGYRRLWATIREWNAPSRRVMDKLGFVETARVEPDDVHGDSLFYMKDLPSLP